MGRSRMSSVCSRDRRDVEQARYEQSEDTDLVRSLADCECYGRLFEEQL